MTFPFTLIPSAISEIFCQMVSTQEHNLRSAFFPFVFENKIPYRGLVGTSGTNQTECCFPFTIFFHFSISRFQTHATQIRPFFGFKPQRMWHFCGKLVNRFPLCFSHSNRIFLSNGKHPNAVCAKRDRRNLAREGCQIHDFEWESLIGFQHHVIILSNQQ